jgi:hypothetical protein
LRFDLEAKVDIGAHLKQAGSLLGPVKEVLAARRAMTRFNEEAPSVEMEAPTASIIATAKGRVAARNI